jgi:hypothetical protein
MRSRIHAATNSKSEPVNAVITSFLMTSAEGRIHLFNWTSSSSTSSSTYTRIVAEFKRCHCQRLAFSAIRPNCLPDFDQRYCTRRKPSFPESDPYTFGKLGFSSLASCLILLRQSDALPHGRPRCRRMRTHSFFMKQQLPFFVGQ